MGAVAEIYAGPLKKALAFARQAMDRKKTIVVLNMVRLDFGGDGTVTLRGTDLDIHASMTVEAEYVSEPFSLLLPPAPLASFFQHVAPETVVRFVAQGEFVTVCAEGCALKMRPLNDLDGWPGIFQTNSTRTDYSAKIDPDVLRRAIAATLPAVSKEEMRYYLNGIYLHQSLDEGVKGLSLCATDGHRLALVNTGAEFDMPDAILPSKAATFLFRALAKTGNGAPLDVFASRVMLTRKLEVKDDTGKVVQDEALALSAPIYTFVGPNWTITAKTIDGTYPDYRRVIPTHDAENPVKISVTVQAKDLQRLPLFGPFRAVKIDPAAGAVTVDNMEGVSASVPCLGHGDAFGLNRVYMTEFIGPYGSARLESASAGHPFLVVTDDPNLVQVIMPMRV